MWHWVVRRAGLEHALREVEMPLVAVLADMEEAGVGVNLRVLRHQQAPIQAKLKEIQTVVGQLTGARVRAPLSPRLAVQIQSTWAASDHVLRPTSWVPGCVLPSRHASLCRFNLTTFSARPAECETRSAD